LRRTGSECPTRTQVARARGMSIVRFSTVALLLGGLRRRSTRGIGRAKAVVLLRCHSAGSINAGCRLLSRCMALRSAGSRPWLGRGAGKARRPSWAGCRSAGPVGAGWMPVSRCKALRPCFSRLAPVSRPALDPTEALGGGVSGGLSAVSAGRGCARRRGAPDQGRRTPRDTGSPAGRLGSPEAALGTDRDENSGRQDGWSFMPCSIGTPRRRGKGAPVRFRRVVSRWHPAAH